jgi:hypothetical protein
MPTHLIASSTALIAFVVAVLMGISAGNSTTRILTTGVGSLLICYGIGLTVANVARRALDEHVADYRRRNPMPQTDQPSDPEEAAAEDAADEPQDAPKGAQGADHAVGQAA